MPKYLFTSDQRISELSSRIKWVAKFVTSGHNVSEIEDKSDNNNATTLKFYYNLHSGTETCKQAAVDPLFAIRNFVLKFQFPNVRTPESLQNTISERLLLAPFRSVVSLLCSLSQINESTESYMTMTEILYFVFCNSSVYYNPSVNYNKIAAHIIESRNKGIDYSKNVETIIEWNQYGRQARELITVLTYASKCFKLTKGNLKFTNTHPDFISDKDFIDQLLTYNKFWYPSNVNDFNLSTLEYISYMNTANTPYSIIEFTPNSVDSKIEIDPQIRQQIFYGAPGTGKSHHIKEQLSDLKVPKENIFRTTFHPDSDYSTFVGAYKPTMKKQYRYDGRVKAKYYEDDDLADAKKDDVIIDKIIQYNFVPQTFLKAYIRAYQTDDNVYLLIEEINRGNCAQIFGDLFQLLDRDDNGKSEYTIKADEDLRAYLEEALGHDSNGIKDGELCLPSNLYIYATMNTSDQSLFPIDSAFKRRWDWKYIPINTEKENWIIETKEGNYSWSSFLNEINREIGVTTSSEDKKLGFYFCKAVNDKISAEKFVSKVLFYVYNDVFKDYGFESKDFFKKNGKVMYFQDYYNVDGTINEENVIQFLNNLKIEKSSESNNQD